MRLSELHPVLYATRVRQLQCARLLSDRRRRVPFARTQAPATLPVVLTRHRSILRRRLGDSDPHLQETKIVNLRLAAATIDGLLIRPGEVFSFWDRVGRPSADRGYVEGLVLARGDVRTAVGGGLCQLSNLLYWMALHAPLEIVERHHHAFDPFPDDGRVLPFGSGASVFYNYGDLRLGNPTDRTFQVRVRVADPRLQGSIACDEAWPLGYHVEERNHGFHRGPDGGVYRDNELWRRTIDRATGRTIGLELVTTNHALVKYPPPDEVRIAAAAC
jgi:vancomycin resistance protein VanW